MYRLEVRGGFENRGSEGKRGNNEDTEANSETCEWKGDSQSLYLIRKIPKTRDK